VRVCRFEIVEKRERKTKEKKKKSARKVENGVSLASPPFPAFQHVGDGRAAEHLRHHVLEHRREVAAQVDPFETKGLKPKPVFHFIGLLTRSRVETMRLQAMGQLHLTCAQPRHEVFRAHVHVLHVPRVVGAAQVDPFESSFEAQL
jgi:hypothetical protein